MKVVVAGGGYAGLACLMALRRRSPDAELVLVAPGAAHLIPTRLHETLRRPIGDFRRSFSELATGIGFVHRREALPITLANLQQWQATGHIPLADGELAFDALVVATGARPRPFAVHPGVIAESVFRTRGGRKVVERLLASEEGASQPLTVVGGGATGLQFLFQLKDVLEGRGASPTLRLVHLEKRLLPELPVSCGDYVRRRLESAGIAHLPGTRYLGQGEGEVELEEMESGRRLRLHSSDAPEMSTVACSNQRARKAGIIRPSQSPRNRCTATGSMLAATGFWPGGGSPKTIG